MKPKSVEFLKLQQEAIDENSSPDRLFELATKSIELARLVASNLSTSSELLGLLAYSSDLLTRQNVAANPNTPPNELIELGAQFPEQLLNNPVFSLLFLENPALVNQIPHPTLRSLLKCENLPHSLKQMFKKQLTQDPIVKHLEQLMLKDSSDRSFVAQNSHTPVKMLQQLAKDKNHHVRRCVASNHNTPIELLESLALDDDIYVRRAVVNNPNATLEIVNKLVKDRHIIVSTAAIDRLQS